jgi:hypothetical protein
MFTEALLQDTAGTNDSSYSSYGSSGHHHHSDPDSYSSVHGNNEARLDTFVHQHTSPDRSLVHARDIRCIPLYNAGAY